MGFSGLGLAVSCALAPSERYAAERGKRHKKLTEWAWQMLLLVRRWYPEREIVAVADGGYASLEAPCDRCRKLCQADHLHHPPEAGCRPLRAGPATQPGQMGRPRLKGERLPNLSVVAEDPATAWTPTNGSQLVRQRGAHRRDGFRYGRLVQHGAARRALALGADPRSARRVRNPGPPMHRPRRGSASRSSPGSSCAGRWRPPSRKRVRHLGFETQRQWSELAIRRTTPALLGLFSLVTLFAHRHMAKGADSRPANGLVPQAPSDLLRCSGAGAQGVVGTGEQTFRGSPREADTVKVPREFMERLTDAVCYAA